MRGGMAWRRDILIRSILLNAHLIIIGVGDGGDGGNGGADWLPAFKTRVIHCVRSAKIIMNINNDIT